MTRHRARPGAGKPPPVQTPPSKPSNGKPSENRVCFYCGEKPAVKLKIFGIILAEPIFCSLNCAAAFGEDKFDESDAAWCVVHQAWTDENGVCWTCESLREPGVVPTPSGERKAGKS